MVVKMPQWSVALKAADASGKEAGRLINSRSSTKICCGTAHTDRYMADAVRTAPGCNRILGFAVPTSGWEKGAGSKGKGPSTLQTTGGSWGFVSYLPRPSLFP